MSEIDLEAIENKLAGFCTRCGPEGLCISCQRLEGEYITALKAEVERLRARVKELEVDPCNWAEDEDGFWQTDCGNTFTLDNETPSENEMKFCAFCGGELTETVYNPEEGDTQP